MSERPGPSGWAAVDEALAATRADIAAAAPDAATAAEGEAYVMRVLTTCLSDAFLGHLLNENGLSRALPTRGGPNPDYRMTHAALDPTRAYKIKGNLKGSERVGIGLYAFGAGGSAQLAGYAAVDAASVDAQGDFALDISASAKGPGALTITPQARVVMIRTLHRDPVREPARLVLDGAPPVTDLTLAQGSTDGALGQVAQALRSSIATFVEWSAVTAAEPNRFLSEEPALSQGVQGDPDTIYHLGYYQLAPGQSLEVVIPAGIPGYWSLHAYNHWCESLPGASLGNDRAIAEADGSVRITVAPGTSGGVVNPIDTLGRRRGVLIFRAIGAKAVDVPRTALRTAS